MWRTVRVSVIDELLGLGSDLVRDHIELTSYDDAKRAEIGFFNVKVVEIKLQWPMRVDGEVSVRRTMVFERFSSDNVVIMHWIVA